MNDRPTASTRRWVPLIAAAALFAGACSDGGGTDGFSVTGSLEQLPAAALDGVEPGDTVEIVIGDFVGASELAGINRPANTNDLDQTVDWLLPLTGFARDGSRSDAFVFTPEVVGQRFSIDFEEYVTELGFGPGAIDTFAEVRAAPDRFSLLTGDIAFPDGLPEVAAGVRTIGAGEDYAAGLDGVTPLRSLGRPLRVAERDGLLAASLSTPAIESWASGDAMSLGADERFAAIGDVLDDIGVVSAYLIDGTFFAPIGDGLLPADEIDVEELTEFASEISPFSTVGIGWTADDDGPLGVAAYRFASDEMAGANVGAVRDAFLGDSIVTEQPISTMLQVDEVRAEGAVVVATYRFGDEAPLTSPINMLFQRDRIFNHL